MKVIEINDKDGELCGYGIKCPACDEDEVGSIHVFYTKSPGSNGWSFNGDFQSPTFSPSMLSKCIYGPKRTEHICHSFVRNGFIEYLEDSTHKFAGKVIELPDWNEV